MGQGAYSASNYKENTYKMGGRPISAELAGAIPNPKMGTFGPAQPKNAGKIVNGLYVENRNYFDNRGVGIEIGTKGKDPLARLSELALKDLSRLRSFGFSEDLALECLELKTELGNFDIIDVKRMVDAKYTPEGIIKFMSILLKKKQAEEGSRENTTNAIPENLQSNENQDTLQAEYFPTSKEKRGSFASRIITRGVTYYKTEPLVQSQATSVDVIKKETPPPAQIPRVLRKTRPSFSGVTRPAPKEETDSREEINTVSTNETANTDNQTEFLPVSEPLTISSSNQTTPVTTTEQTQSLDHTSDTIASDAVTDIESSTTTLTEPEDTITNESPLEIEDQGATILNEEELPTFALPKLTELSKNDKRQSPQDANNPFLMRLRREYEDKATPETNEQEEVTQPETSREQSVTKQEEITNQEEKYPAVEKMLATLFQNSSTSDWYKFVGAIKNKAQAPTQVPTDIPTNPEANILPNWKSNLSLEAQTIANEITA